MTTVILKLHDLINKTMHMNMKMKQTLLIITNHGALQQHLSTKKKEEALVPPTAYTYTLPHLARSTSPCTPAYTYRCIRPRLWGHTCCRTCSGGGRKDRGDSEAPPPFRPSRLLVAGLLFLIPSARNRESLCVA